MLLSEVHNAESETEYQEVIRNIREFDSGSEPGHDGRTSTDLIDEAVDKLNDEGLNGWSEAGITELLTEAIARAGN